MGIEQAVNQKLNNYPCIKKYIKRVYQRFMYTISSKTKSEGKIIRVSPDDEYEYFFGYYDKSPWDATDRYMLCLKAKCTWNEVSPNNTAQILLIDTYCDNKVSVLGETHSWNVQQGCMLQWKGPDYVKNIIYNDYRNDQYCAIIATLEYREDSVKIISEKILSMPVYSVSNDGKFALTLDFSRLHRLRPGYGYHNLPDRTRNEKLPNKTCIWHIDLETGYTKGVLKYTDFSNFEFRPEMLQSEHKVNHIMISPDGKRFMVLHRWLQKDKKFTRLITCRVDGSDMYNLCDDDMISHCCWRTDGQILAFANKKKIGNGYYLMKDKTHEYIHFWEGIDCDGHPSYSPDGSKVVFDCYPDRKRMSSIMISDAKNIYKEKVVTLAKVFSPFKYDNETRCDLHPRWNRIGNKVCFDSAHESHRGMYMVDTESYKENIQGGNGYQRGLVSVIIPTYKRNKTLGRSIDSVIGQTYRKLEVLIVDDNERNTSESNFVKNLVESYQDERVKYVEQKRHINGAAARNAGIRVALGEYIAFLDDDDEWMENKLEKQVQVLKKNPGAQGVSTLYSVYVDGKKVRECSPYTGEELHRKVIGREVSVFTSTILLCRNALDKSGYFNETLIRHQDLQLLLDFLYQNKMQVINEVLVKLHADSEMNHPDIIKLIDIKKHFFNVCDKHLRKYSRREQKVILGAHYFEIIVEAIKSKKIGIVIEYVFKIGLNYSAYINVYKRWKERGRIKERQL